MQFILRSFSSYRPQPLLLHHPRRAFSDANVKWVRDRGLDHAVEKEKNLLPLINLKNLLKSEPSKSLPVNIIAEKRDSLCIQIRAVDFVRRYPSVFEEFLPGGIGVHPHIRLTPEALHLDAEEQLIYQSESFRNQAADRLLRLLMMSRINKIPLNIIDRLKWDLGLPQDYLKSILPEFPDYFQVKSVKKFSSVSDVDVLELVCWSNKLAFSVMENKVIKGESGYERGMPIAFPLQYSRGFEMDKKTKKWVNEWQKLPYISPYENALHLPPKSEESDKWAVAVLHELLHILVPKKTERENILLFGEYMGLRSRFKRALLQHPGIFYISSKNSSHTVVLREAYKRDLLIEKHPIMNMRYRYIHLMNTVREEHKVANVPSESIKQEQKTNNSKKGEGQEEADDESEVKREGDTDVLSGSEVDDVFADDIDDSDDEGDVDYEEEDEDNSRRVAYRNVSVSSGRATQKINLEVKGSSRNPARGRSVGRYPVKSKDEARPKVSRRPEMRDGRSIQRRMPRRSKIKFSKKQGEVIAR